MRKHGGDAQEALGIETPHPHSIVRENSTNPNPNSPMEEGEGSRREDGGNLGVGALGGGGSMSGGGDGPSQGQWGGGGRMWREGNGEGGGGLHEGGVPSWRHEGGGGGVPSWEGAGSFNQGRRGEFYGQGQGSGHNQEKCGGNGGNGQSDEGRWKGNSEIWHGNKGYDARDREDGEWPKGGNPRASFEESR